MEELATLSGGDDALRSESWEYLPGLFDWCRTHLL